MGDHVSANGAACTTDEVDAVGSTERDPVTSRRWIIAIDGPAGGGKSTVGEQVARQLDALYFDSGIVYRALTVACLDAGLNPDDGVALGDLARRATVQVLPPSVDDGRQNDVLLNGVDITPLLRTAEVGQNVSRVSVHPPVRDAMLALQRNVGRSGRVVMVGRDIGTRIFPDADLKVYLDASTEARIARRALQLEEAGSPQPIEQVRAEVQARDRTDSTRATAPLRAADDAVVLDTTNLSITEVIAHICHLAETHGLLAHAEPLAHA